MISFQNLIYKGGLACTGQVSNHHEACSSFTTEPVQEASPTCTQESCSDRHRYLIDHFKAQDNMIDIVLRHSDRCMGDPCCESMLCALLTAYSFCPIVWLSLDLTTSSHPPKTKHGLNHCKHWDHFLRCSKILFSNQIPCPRQPFLIEQSMISSAITLGLLAVNIAIHNSTPGSHRNSKWRSGELIMPISLMGLLAATAQHFNRLSGTVSDWHHSRDDP